MSTASTAVELSNQRFASLAAPLQCIIAANLQDPSTSTSVYGSEYAYIPNSLCPALPTISAIVITAGGVRLLADSPMWMLEHVVGLASHG